MKILITTHYFPPHRGGIENVAFNQARMLAKQGNHVTVVTSNCPKNSESNHEFKIIRVNAWNILEDKLGVPFPLFRPRLHKVLREEIKAADVVHSHGHTYLPSVVAARITHRLRKPFILTQHNTYIEYKSRLLRFMQTTADKTLGKSTLKRATKVIAVSQATKEYMESILPVDTLIQYNGIDTARFQPAKNQKALREQLELPVGKTICFTIRRITFKNGIDTMIGAAKLIQKRSDVLFLIGGKGPDLESAKVLVKQLGLKNVAFLGAVSEENLPMYYAASDIFILPSKKGEGFPLVVLEALASGLPVIATRSGGHVELLESSGCGYIVEPNAPEQIAQLIDDLTKQRSKLARMKLLCRNFTEQGLSWEKNVAELLHIFKEAQA